MHEINTLHLKRLQLNTHPVVAGGGGLQISSLGAEFSKIIVSLSAVSVVCQYSEFARSPVGTPPYTFSGSAQEGLGMLISLSEYLLGGPFEKFDSSKECHKSRFVSFPDGVPYTFAGSAQEGLGMLISLSGTNFTDILEFSGTRSS